ncbi:aspartic peptidase domain-containing protein [Staphylotrichum tortipilum]|uniref:Aspartic peptidase domain-containing protein n=1 Tax=Staphylotrichum tortipilum TaxID=2831512 RepID=A0AAN6MC52_9PEZI|nr:aspartic peptidase domain-containing protein [Staphylotrichum longicolle]
MSARLASSVWRHSVFLTLVLLSLFTFSSAIDCAPPPIGVTLRNVTLSTRNTRRGIAASVGTPPQDFAFLPGWYTNNTYLYGTDGRCKADDWSAAACTTLRGGAYDASASKTQKTPSTDAYPPDSSPYNAMRYISDTLKLNDNVSVPFFPMGVAINDLETQGYYPQMTFGIGTNSTLLNTLKSSGKIASKTFSYFAGRFGGTKDAQMDGAVAFGGYDKAKVKGQRYTTPMMHGTACSTNMVVTIIDIVLNFRNGTNASLFGGSQSESMVACLAPSVPVFMNLPLDPYFSNWLTLSNSSLSVGDLYRSVGINFWNMRYHTGYKPYDGDVTLKFPSGLSIRLPNELLVVPEVDIDPKTGALMSNATDPNFLINSGQDVNARDMAALGATFFSAAYLMVNQDADEFSLWAANPSTQSNLVAVDSTGAEVAKACATTSGTAKPTSMGGASGGGDGKGSDSGVGASGAGESTVPEAGGSGLGTGAIAGIAVGGAAVVLLLGALAFWLIMRRKAKAAAANAVAVAAAAAGAHEVEWDPHHVYYHEAGGLAKFVTHEVDGERPAAEMAATPSVQYVPPRQSERQPSVWHELA